MTNEEIKASVIEVLEDLKARDVVTLDVRGLTSMTDFMVIATGTSSRHVKSMASELEVVLKARGEPPIGVEGQDEAEWVLVDFGDVLVHVMQAGTRAFYELEKLWSAPAAESGAD